MAKKIDIALEFTTKPGPRYIEEGEFSGELFRTLHLVPAFDLAVASKEKLVIDLNGTEGYATSFLEEAFGGLARTYGEAKVAAIIEFVCDDDPYLIDEINNIYERQTILSISGQNR